MTGRTPEIEEAAAAQPSGAAARVESGPTRPRRRRLNRRTVGYYAVSAAAVLAGLALWQFVIAATVDPLYFPTLEQCLEALGNLGSGILEDMWATAYRVLLGLLLGAALGVAVALAMSASRTVTAVTEPYLAMLRPIPALALAPLFVLWFGIGDLGKILLISLAGFMVMAIAVFDALRHVSPVFVQSARSLGASMPAVYRTVLFPAIGPEVWSALRVSASLAYGVGIAAEFTGAESGVGYTILLARRTFATETMIVGIVAIGILAYCTDKVIKLIGDRTTHWARGGGEVVR